MSRAPPSCGDAEAMGAGVGVFCSSGVEEIFDDVGANVGVSSECELPTSPVDEPQPPTANEAQAARVDTRDTNRGAVMRYNHLHDG
jgi:hypothetical protein